MVTMRLDLTKVRGPAGWPALRWLLTRAMGMSIAALPTAASGEFGKDWPEGEGADEVGWFCSACHTRDIIKHTTIGG